MRERLPFFPASLCALLFSLFTLMCMGKPVFHFSVMSVERESGSRGGGGAYKCAWVCQKKEAWLKVCGDSFLLV